MFDLKNWYVYFILMGLVSVLYMMYEGSSLGVYLLGALVVIPAMWLIAFIKHYKKMSQQDTVSQAENNP